MEKTPQNSKELIDNLKENILKNIEKKLEIFYAKASNGAFNLNEINEATKLFIELKKIRNGKLTTSEQELESTIKDIQNNKNK